MSLFVLAAGALAQPPPAFPVEPRPETEAWLAPRPEAPDAVPWRLATPTARLGLDAVQGLGSSVQASRVHGAVAAPALSGRAWVVARSGGFVGQGGGRGAGGGHGQLLGAAELAGGHRVTLRGAADQRLARGGDPGDRRGWGHGVAASWAWAPGESLMAEGTLRSETRDLLGTRRVQRAAQGGAVVRGALGDRADHTLSLRALVQETRWSEGGYWIWRWLGGEQRGPEAVERTALHAEEAVRASIGAARVALTGSLGSEHLAGVAYVAPRAELGLRGGEDWELGLRGWGARRWTHLDMPTAVEGLARRDEAGLAADVVGLEGALTAGADLLVSDHHDVPFLGGERIDLRRVHTGLTGVADGGWVRTELGWRHVSGLSGGRPLDDGSLARFKDAVDASVAVRLVGEETPLWLGLQRALRRGPLGVVGADPAWDVAVPVDHDLRQLWLEYERDLGGGRVTLGASGGWLTTREAPEEVRQWLAVQSPLQPLPGQEGWRVGVWLGWVR